MVRLMKNTLLFLFLIVVLPSEAFPQNTPSSSLNDEPNAPTLDNKNLPSSPLMMVKAGSGEVAKRNLDHGITGHPVDRGRNSSPADSSSFMPRSATSMTSQGAQENQAVWQHIYVSPGSQTFRIQTFILDNGVALKTEIPIEAFIEARDSGTKMRAEGEERLKEIELSFETKNTPSHYGITSFFGFNDQLKEAADKKIALSEKKAAELKHFSVISLSALPLRNVILDRGGQDNPIQQLILDLDNSGQEIIKTLREELKTISDAQQKKEKAEQIITTANVVQKIQQLMLRCDTPFYITAAKDRLNGLYEKVAADSNFEDIKDILKNLETRFPFAEAESPEAALDLITNIIKELEANIEEYKNNIADIRNHEKEIANGEALVKFQEQKSNFLQNAMLAYQQIQNELMVETKCDSPTDLKDSIEEDLKRLESIEYIQEKLNILKEILNYDQTTAIFTAAGPSLRFLTNIHSLEDSDDMIIGEHGKIILEKNDTQRSWVIDQKEKIKKKWVNGMNLIRFAIVRKYGMQALQCFDTKFRFKRSADISLSVQELKKFLTDEIKIPSSHFLNEALSVEKLMQKLNNAHEEDILKGDKPVFEFNPFLLEQASLLQGNRIKNSNIEEQKKLLEESHAQQAMEGKRIAREVIEKKLKTFAISQNRLNRILRGFDKKFHDRQYLTVKDLKTFLSSKEDELKHSPKDLWIDTISDDTRKSLISGAISGTASLTVALFAHHLLSLNLYCFSVGIVIGFIISHIILPAII